MKKISLCFVLFVLLSNSSYSEDLSNNKQVTKTEESAIPLCQEESNYNNIKAIKCYQTYLSSTDKKIDDTLIKYL